MKRKDQSQNNLQNQTIVKKDITNDPITHKDKKLITDQKSGTDNSSKIKEEKIRIAEEVPQNKKEIERKKNIKEKNEADDLIEKIRAVSAKKEDSKDLLHKIKLINKNLFLVKSNKFETNLLIEILKSNNLDVMELGLSILKSEPDILEKIINEEDFKHNTALFYALKALHENSETSKTDKFIDIIETLLKIKTINTDLDLSDFQIYQSLFYHKKKLASQDFESESKRETKEVLDIFNLMLQGKDKEGKEKEEIERKIKQDLSDKKTDPNILCFLQDSYSATIFTAALEFGYSEVAQNLLAERGKVNIRTILPDGSNILFPLLRSSLDIKTKIKIFDELVDQGINLQTTCSIIVQNSLTLKLTILDYAVCSGQIEMVRHILAKCGNYVPTSEIPLGKFAITSNENFTSCKELVRSYKDRKNSDLIKEFQNNLDGISNQDSDEIRKKSKQNLLTLLKLHPLKNLGFKINDKNQLMLENDVVELSKLDSEITFHILTKASHDLEIAKNITKDPALLAFMKNQTDKTDLSFWEKRGIEVMKELFNQAKISDDKDKEQKQKIQKTTDDRIVIKREKDYKLTEQQETDLEIFRKAIDDKDHKTIENLIDNTDPKLFFKKSYQAGFALFHEIVKLGNPRLVDYMLQKTPEDQRADLINSRFYNLSPFLIALSRIANSENNSEENNNYKQIIEIFRKVKGVDCTDISDQIIPINNLKIDKETINRMNKILKNSDEKEVKESKDLKKEERKDSAKPSSSSDWFTSEISTYEKFLEYIFSPNLLAVIFDKLNQNTDEDDIEDDKDKHQQVIRLMFDRDSLHNILRVMDLFKGTIDFHKEENCIYKITPHPDLRPELLLNRMKQILEKADQNLHKERKTIFENPSYEMDTLIAQGVFKHFFKLTNMFDNTENITFENQWHYSIESRKFLRDFQSGFNELQHNKRLELAHDLASVPQIGDSGLDKESQQDSQGPTDISPDIKNGDIFSIEEQEELYDKYITSAVPGSVQQSQQTTFLISKNPVKKEETTDQNSALQERSLKIFQLLKADFKTPEQHNIAEQIINKLIETGIDSQINDPKSGKSIKSLLQEYNYHTSLKVLENQTGKKSKEKTEEIVQDNKEKTSLYQINILDMAIFDNDKDAIKNIIETSPHLVNQSFNSSYDNLNINSVCKEIFSYQKGLEYFLNLVKQQTPSTSTTPVGGINLSKTSQQNSIEQG